MKRLIKLKNLTSSIPDNFFEVIMPQFKGADNIDELINYILTIPSFLNKHFEDMGQDFQFNTEDLKDLMGSKELHEIISGYFEIKLYHHMVGTVSREEIEYDVQKFTELFPDFSFLGLIQIVLNLNLSVIYQTLSQDFIKGLEMLTSQSMTYFFLVLDYSYETREKGIKILLENPGFKEIDEIIIKYQDPKYTSVGEMLELRKKLLIYCEKFLFSIDIFFIIISQADPSINKPQRASIVQTGFSKRYSMLRDFYTQENALEVLELKNNSFAEFTRNFLYRLNSLFNKKRITAEEYNKQWEIFERELPSYAALPEIQAVRINTNGMKIEPEKAVTIEKAPQVKRGDMVTNVEGVVVELNINDFLVRLETSIKNSNLKDKPLALKRFSRSNKEVSDLLKSLGYKENLQTRLNSLMNSTRDRILQLKIQLESDQNNAIVAYNLDDGHGGKVGSLIFFVTYTDGLSNIQILVKNSSEIEPIAGQRSIADIAKSLEQEL